MLLAWMQEWGPELLWAVLSTVKLMVMSFLLAAATGLCLALARLSGAAGLRRAATVYIEAVRGMPALALLFLIYFGLPSLGLVLNAVASAVLGLGLHGGAYMCEIFRAGIQSVPNGQREAAKMIGMREAQTLRYVVLPQAFRTVLPPTGNYAISLLKETSVASLISAPELMLTARDISSENFMPLQVYLLVGVIYLCLSLPLSGLVHLVESRGRAA